MVIRGVLTGGDFFDSLSPDWVALEVDGGMLTTIGSRLERRRTIGVTTYDHWLVDPAPRALSNCFA